MAIRHLTDEGLCFLHRNVINLLLTFCVAVVYLLIPIHGFICVLMGLMMCLCKHAILTNVMCPINNTILLSNMVNVSA